MDSLDSLSSQCDVYGEYKFYVTLDKFYIQPLQNEEELLIIDRVSNEITLSSFQNQIPLSATTRHISGILGILTLLAGQYLIIITSKIRVGTINRQTIWKIGGFDVIPFARTFLHLTDQQNLLNKQYVSMVYHALSQPDFYFSTSYDLSHTLQRLHNTSPEFLKMPLFERADPRFVWNGHLMRDLLVQKELSKYCIPVIHGFVSVNSVTLNGHQMEFILISRRSCRRAGTRMFVRGVDGEGHVANFVETEQIVESDNNRSALVLTRGSIPLFWSQLPDLRYKPPPQISSTQNHLEAFQKHFDSLLFNYGRQVAVNLVNHHGAESKLERAFAEYCRKLGNPSIKYVAFDFHRECGATKWENLSILMDKISQDITDFKYFMMKDKKCISLQEGVFRVNCIDCLDRTNVVQSMIAFKSLEDQLKKLGILSNAETLETHLQFGKLFKNVWADNGDICSIQYAGTGALKSDYTRSGKRTIFGMAKDGVLSLRRYYKNNFADGFRQDSIDLILGNYQVDESEALTTPCPLNEKKDWRFILLPMIFLIALAMCFMSILIPSVITAEVAFYLLFWLGMVLISLLVIFYYGVEFVDYPRLINVRPKLKYD